VPAPGFGKMQVEFVIFTTGRFEKHAILQASKCIEKHGLFKIRSGTCLQKI